MKKNTPFDWLLAYQLAFDSLKKMVMKVSILAHYKQNIMIIVEIDFFDYINSKIFFQLGNNRLLQFMAFFFIIFNSAKCNYKIYYKKLLVIIKCFK